MGVIFERELIRGLKREIEVGRVEGGWDGVVVEDEDGVVEVLNEGVYIDIWCIKGSGGVYILVFNVF